MLAWGATPQTPTVRITCAGCIEGSTALTWTLTISVRPLLHERQAK